MEIDHTIKCTQRGGSGGVAELFNKYTAFAEDPSLIPRALFKQHTTACNSSAYTSTLHGHQHTCVHMNPRFKKKIERESHFEMGKR